MKVGMIGLGRMGEGMSRRLIAAGHEVHGYRNNVKKAEEQFEKGYISGYTTSLESLVQVVHNSRGIFTDDAKAPGIFMMVVPAETVEDTLNDLLRYCREGDIIIDHGNSNFKDSRRRAERLAKLGISYLDCVLVVVFTVWSVDTVLWLAAEIMQSPLVREFLMPSHQGSSLPPGLNLTATSLGILRNMVGCIVVDLAQVTL